MRFCCMLRWRARTAYAELVSNFIVARMPTALETAQFVSNFILAEGK